MATRRKLTDWVLAVAFCLLAPVGGAVDARAQLPARLPPLPAGMARVWWLRQYEPFVSLATPMLYVNDAPLTASEPGTAFFRDLAPGTYTFSVASEGWDYGQQARLRLLPGMQVYLEVQASKWWDSGRTWRRDTFYVVPIPPQRAFLYMAQMRYLGGR